VPFENMKEGTSFDVLGRIRKAHYHIQKEIILDLVLQVVAKTSNPREIEEIYATTHSINECYNTLKETFGKYQRFEVKNDVVALQKLEEDSRLKRGAVVSSYQPLGDVNVVVNNVRDSRENFHKYVYITRNLDVNGVHNRTLIACSPKFNRMGSLYDILHEFVIRGINIIKILSSPQASNEDDIIIYLELDGNMENKILTEALGIVKYKSRFISILGSYYAA
jgi:prephenate dehydratase